MTSDEALAKRALDNLVARGEFDPVEVGRPGLLEGDPVPRALTYPWLLTDSNSLSLVRRHQGL